jgi:hypothetical protein
LRASLVDGRTGQHERARRIAWVATIVGTLGAETIGLAAALLPGVWTGLFSDDPAVRSAGAKYLAIIGPLYGAAGITFILTVSAIARAAVRSGPSGAARHVCLAFRQVTVAHDALVAVRGLQIGMLAEKVRDLGLDRLGQQSTGPIAQDFGELIVDVSWLNQLDDVSLDTAYRSFGGEVEASSTPTICRLPDSRRHQLSAIALAFAALGARLGTASGLHRGGL